ncbi:hypothetical protein [Singulisphaera sp. GP187]|uniref:hypothetical protein n=1 Tax=Singulisphaera sp. GP187 TaxID=1882752 RepID=UPI0011610C41|nr:hypothetical protein [Singulisphaera sp. GP187]
MGSHGLRRLPHPRLRARGVLPGDNGPGQPSMTWNEESRFVNGFPPGGLWEAHYNYLSFDGTSNYRPIIYYMDQNTHLFYTEHRLGTAVWYGRDASFPLLSVQSVSGDNSGSVAIRNQGTNGPLSVVGTASDVVIGLNAGQFFRLYSVQDATVGNPTRNSVGLTMTGAYWTGTASAGAASSLQTIVTGNNIFHAFLGVGTGEFRFQNDNKVGLGVPLAKLTQNIVMNPGYLAAIESNGIGVFRLIGLNSSDRVEIDSDGRGTVFPNSVYYGAYGSGAGPRIRSGTGGTDNFLVINAGSAGSSTNNLYLNLDSPNASVGIYGQTSIFAAGASGQCLSVGGVGPTGILLAGNGVGHCGLRYTPTTGTTGLVELMSAGGNDPRTWTPSGYSFKVSGGFASGINATAKTTAYTLTTSDSTILGNATGGAFAVTLPAANAVPAGRLFTVKKTDASANAVTLTRAGADLIDGAATYALASQWKYATIQSDGVSNWYVVANN